MDFAGVNQTLAVKRILVGGGRKRLKPFFEIAAHGSQRSGSDDSLLDKARDADRHTVLVDVGADGQFDLVGVDAVVVRSSGTAQCNRSRLGDAQRWDHLCCQNVEIIL